MGTILKLLAACFEQMHTQTALREAIGKKKTSDARSHDADIAVCVEASFAGLF
ncbi:MAG: hypothetical protein PW792_00010 [Acidobacteriaceae bacterium]|nr:hypothetical protein [Acidobacteriaceae bacterium]